MWKPLENNMPLPDARKLGSRLRHLERHPEFRQRLNDEERIVCAFANCDPTYLPPHITKEHAIHVLGEGERCMAVCEYWLKVAGRERGKRSLVGASWSVLSKLTCTKVVGPSEADLQLLLRHLAWGPNLSERMSDEERIGCAFASCDPTYLPSDVRKEEAICLLEDADQSMTVFQYWLDVAARGRRKGIINRKASDFR